MEIKDKPMIEILRSGMFESLHLGSVAVVDFNGQILAEYGDPELRTFIRSSAKPLQAIPTFTDPGCMKHFKFNGRERAYLVASHSGERRHQEIGKRVMDKLGITFEDLKCGTHPPFYTKTLDEMREKKEEFTPLCHNCSGNHMVMIALSVYKGWSIKNYVDPDHPVQQEILKWVSILSGVPKKKIRVGSDGCTAPVYHQTLREMAQTWGRFSAPEKLASVSNPDNLDIENGAKAMRRIMADYWGNPGIIGGINRFDSMLNRIGKGRFFAKGGGEALQMVGVADEGIGIAVKMLDGDPLMRAKCTAVLEVLHQLGLIDDETLKKIEKSGRFYKPDFSNIPGGKFQTLEPRFKIKKLAGWKKRFESGM